MRYQLEGLAEFYGGDMASCLSISKINRTISTQSDEIVPGR